MIISSTKELLQEIDKILSVKANKEIEHIIFICPNLNANFITQNNQSPQNLGQEILNKLQQTHKKLTIHSFETLSKEQILGTKQSYNLPKHISIKTYCNDDTIIKDLLDSIKKSANLDTKNYQSLEEMLDDIQPENINNISLQAAQDKAIKYINNFLAESDLFADIMQADAKENITQLFNKLEQYIKQAIEDREKEYYKNIIKTIFGVLLAVVTGGSVALILLGISAVLLTSFIDYQDAQNNKYGYIQNPIIEFLATELAMYVQLVNTKLLSCMLIVESTQQEKGGKKIEFIDLSGFNLELDNTLSSCFQSIAFRGELDNSLDILTLLNQKAIALPRIQHNSIMAKMLHIYQPKPNTKNDDNASQSSSQTVSKRQNIKNTPLLTSMLKEVQHFNHFAYIESPHFNSALLAEILNNKNTQYPNTHTTNMAKNYLIITNAPSKYNAKLTEAITQHIVGNTIKDDINNRTKQELAISSNAKKKNYNTTRDYSTYKIEINKNDDEAYMVQLSPFVRVDSVDIEENCKNSEIYKKAEKSLQQAKEAYNDSANDGVDSIDNLNLICEQESKLNDIKKYYGMDYVNQFFKTPKEVGDIIKKEEQTAKDFLTQLQYFHNRHMNDRRSLGSPVLAIFSLFYGLYVFKMNFPSFALRSKKIEDIDDTMMIKVDDLGMSLEFELIKQNESQNVRIAQALQKELLYKSPQEIELSEDFLKYLKNFMKETDNTKNTAEVFDDDIQKEIDIDKELEQELAQIKSYGKKYEAIVDKERTQEVFYTSMLKILGAICPFANFIHEDMIMGTKHCLAIFIQILENLGKKALFDTLLTEMGLFAFYLYPTTMRVHIGINEGVIQTSKTSNEKVDIANKIKARLAELSNPKNKEDIQNFFKGFAKVELRRTKAQIAHFEAKTAFIFDTIDKDAKTLNLSAIKEKLKKTMTSPSDQRLLDKIFFTYGSGKAQSHLIGEIQMREIFYQAKQFYRNKVLYAFKINVSAVVLDIALNVILEYYFSTHYEAYAREYETMMHKRYTFYYDLPYAVKRKESILEIDTQNHAIKKDKELTYYPMLVMAKFMSFDLQSMLYGTELCTGGLTHHIGLAYLLRQNNSDDLQKFLLTKLLSYLIIDEKRVAKDIEDYEIHYNKQVPDYTFFNHKALDSKGNIIDTTSHISLDDILKYQVPKDSDLYNEFKALEENNKKLAIDAYNEALDILHDYKDYYFTNTRSGKRDKDKARRLMQCLDIIGQNNIRALYVGVNDEKPNNDNNQTPPQLFADADSKEDSNQSQQDKKRPKFIGRLATTIIIEDGLWLG